MGNLGARAIAMEDDIVNEIVYNKQDFGMSASRVRMNARKLGFVDRDWIPTYEYVEVRIFG